MADNYLEKRMEDLRSGRIGTLRPKVKSGRRVAVAGIGDGSCLSRVLAFRRQGCRVAVIDTDAQAGGRLAYEHGVRFHRVESFRREDLEKETGRILDAWRGIDVIAGSGEACRVMEECVRRWRLSLPIPDNTLPEIMIL